MDNTKIKKKSELWCIYEIKTESTKTYWGLYELNKVFFHISL